MRYSSIFLLLPSTVTLSLASTSADAQDLEVRVVPNFRTVRVGDGLSIEIIISGVKIRSHSKDAGPGDRPEFKHRFSLRPRSVGTVKLGPYEVELDGRRIVSDEVQVKVLPEWTGGEGFDFRLSEDTAKVGESVELVVWQWYKSGRPAYVSIEGNESFSVEHGRGTVMNRNVKGIPIKRIRSFIVTPRKKGTLVIGRDMFHNLPDDVELPQLTIAVSGD